MTSAPRIRMSYSTVENRTFFKCMFRHMLFVLRRGCPRTSLELSKMLLGLDLDADSMGVLLCIDALALRAREHEWFLEFLQSTSISQRTLSSLPGIAFGRALALGVRDGLDSSDARTALKRAIGMFPFALTPLVKLAKLTEGVGSRSERWGRVMKHPFWSEKIPSIASRLAAIMAEMQHDLWSAPRNGQWLLEVCEEVLDSDVSKKGSEIWRNVRAVMEATFAPGSIVERYRNLSAYDFSERGGQLQGAMDLIGPQQRREEIGPPRDTRDPMTLDGSENPLMLFFRTMMPWNRVDTSRAEAAAAASRDATDAILENEEEEDTGGARRVINVGRLAAGVRIDTPTNSPIVSSSSSKSNDDDDDVGESGDLSTSTNRTEAPGGSEGLSDAIDGDI